jgi:D-amino peptidase
MKVFVMTDMEGISGVCRADQVTHGAALYESGRRYLTWEVNACVEGCLRGGATDVVVRDGHSGDGDNFIWEELDPRAEYVMGEAGRRRFGPIEEFDAVILLGYHAMAGTTEAILEHTMSPAGWQDFWLNGCRCGEIGIVAAVAGENGIPAIMVSGDDKACREAQDLLPGVLTACVKTGYAVEGGRLLSAEVAHRLIRETAAEAVDRAGEIEPFVVEPPVTARLERVSRGRLPVDGDKPYVRILDGRTYEVTGESVEQAIARL